MLTILTNFEDRNTLIYTCTTEQGIHIQNKTKNIQYTGSRKDNALTRGIVISTKWQSIQGLCLSKKRLIFVYSYNYNSIVTILTNFEHRNTQNKFPFANTSLHNRTLNIQYIGTHIENNKI